MKKRVKDLMFIGYALAAFYVGGMMNLLANAQANIYIFAIFIISLTAALAVAQIKEWGRLLLVATTAFTTPILFLVILSTPSDLGYKGFEILPTGYLVLNVGILVYFNQAGIKQRFRSVIGEWRSILIVDDDESLVKTLRHILISHGYSVLTANTGESGLDIAQVQKPDLILLDVILPGIKGREVCKKLKADEQTKDIPIVFLTAKQSPDDIQAEKDVGATAHITKPVEAKTLVSTVHDILKSKA